MTEMINALVNHPDGGNFNQVINEALFYGLPILYEKLYGGTVTEEEKISLVKPRKKGSKYEELNAVTVQLLRETVLNATINKSILSSIFNFICEKCSDERDIIKEFNTGLLADSKSLIRDFSRTRPNTLLALRRKGSRNSGGKENQQPTDHFQYSVYAVSSAENSDERGA